MLGSCDGDGALMTIVERKTRFSIIRKLPNKGSASVMAAFDELRQGMFRGCFDKVFLTLTTDNGSEFSRLPDLEASGSLRVYHVHPCCPGEKGTNENHNRLFRRFIPKGKRI